jgi:RHS repeat-associated protein
MNNSNNFSGNKQTTKSSSFKTDGGKTKSNAIEAPSIALPKGGGAIKGIDEKFSVNAVNGSASFSIPLPVSPARGASPTLSLSYNSGGGNGIFGLGWNMSLPSIKRKTDKGLPQYFESIDSDTFLFSEAEDLVPEFKKEDGNFIVDDIGEYVINEITDGLHTIRFYKPRIEGLFARIERWIEKTSDRIKWRVITKENQTTLFGWTDNAIIANPTDAKKIYEWLPEFVFDDKGNCCHYIYKAEDEKGITNKLHNRNRLNTDGKINYTNCYLEKILYGNKTPYKVIADLFPLESDYVFETIFDYGEYETNSPYKKINDWNFRTDAFSDYKAGFEIRTTRLCKRVLHFHHFTAESEYDGLVKSLNFEYDANIQEDFTFLKSITSFGHLKKTDGTYSSKHLPATEFTYQKHDWNTAIKTIATEDLVHAPYGLDEQQYQFTDLFNEGLSGILTEQGNGWYYKHNLGDGKFEQAKLVSPKPSFAGLGSQMQLVDLDADGGKQLASFNGEPAGFFELDDDNEWQRFKYFENMPNINLQDANARMLDLNGDGKADLLITEDNVFTWYESDGRKGYVQWHKTIKGFDEEAGPHLVFSDSLQTIFLADMSGDGLTDIARIRNGEICYWPNLGFGKFGAKVAMDNAPVFDLPGSYNPSFLRLADIDGSGTPDIIYLGINKFTCWMNLSGNSYSTTPFEITAFPDVHSQAKINVTDILGNGVACIVWSSSLTKDVYAPLRYIDLMNSKKPHIMVAYKNNMGKEVSMEYTPSTKFYIEDKLAGKPWVTKLHFPVHCISKTITEDKITGHRFTVSYKYHHGCYDHIEREFRGFGMVEQFDTEQTENWKKEDENILDDALNQKTVLTKSWVHTGAFLRNEKILTQFEQDYWYNEMARQGFPVLINEHNLPEARIVDAKGNTITDLSIDERREALRACKSMALRSEIFALDANSVDDIEKQLTPFTVATHNCVIEMLQPKGKNKYAVFVVKESEAITYNYERIVADPRIAHNINIKLDEYGNVLESVAIVYPRFITNPTLPDVTQAAQADTKIIYTKHQFTNDVIDDTIYRLRLPSEVQTFELKKIAHTTPTYYAVPDFIDILNETKTNTLQYSEWNTTKTTSTKRLIEHIRSLYYKNDLIDSLPLGQLESLALPYESYLLAYTPELLNNIFNTRWDDGKMLEGKFTQMNGDPDSYRGWWIRSGTTQFIDLSISENAANAQSRFYLPQSYTDPYGAKTKVNYYSRYHLFIKDTIDALGNTTSVDKFNFRTLSPQQMKDMNDNLSEVFVDELGLVKAMAVKGKGTEADDLIGLDDFTVASEIALVNSFFNVPHSVTNVANSDTLRLRANDLLQHATARFVYDFDAYKNHGKPVVVSSIVRAEHYKINEFSPIQISFEYTGGLGKVVMKKVQAEPGDAKKVDINSDGIVTVRNENTAPHLRWIGNGRTILNNKGNPVKQYEPYFSTTFNYEDQKELVEVGVTPVMYYDALSRLIKTEMPDGTFTKVEFDAWEQKTYDQVDTVLESNWYAARSAPSAMTSQPTDPEQRAAWLSAIIANTPSTVHLDTLGRSILSIEHNRIFKVEGIPKKASDIIDAFYETKMELDIENNLRTVTDARKLLENAFNGNVVMQYKYDMLGNLVYQKSMDAGQRWLLHNILGKPLYTWDERNHEFHYKYDELQRPIESWVFKGDGLPALKNLFDKIEYGENVDGAITNNLRGQVIKHYDTGGLIETPNYDFKGQPTSTTRKIFKDYKAVPDWNTATDALALETEAFTFITKTDALGRISLQTAPDGSVITPSYNEAGVLNSETVLHNGATLAATYIEEINYNEKGQRNFIKYGNGVKTTYKYDEKTFRLKQLESKKQDGDRLQDLYYTYDPVGNITHIEDKNIPLEFFNNNKITGISEYAYDALYRLIEASGRENNIELTFDKKDNWNDAAYMQQLNAGNAMNIHNYTQKFQYDAVGNILEMKHLTSGAFNNWTRKYNYELNNNRLISTQIGTAIPAYNYIHHTQHGYITAMPHLTVMGWNFKEELIKTATQLVTEGSGDKPETTYYQYDGQGQRIRKITENFAKADTTATKKEERIYIAGYELYKKTSTGLERTSLSLLEEGHRFVMIETRNDIDDGTLVRYQLHNHLGSAALELNETADIISYEEYHPFGTTAYQANNANIKAAAKRYRYTGMERDEETGMEYHSARYYLPWLGRWCSADPIGIGDGVNVYGYCNGNPINSNDSNGTQTDEGVPRLLAAPTGNNSIEPQTEEEFVYGCSKVINLPEVIVKPNYSFSNGVELTQLGIKYLLAPTNIEGEIASGVMHTWSGGEMENVKALIDITRANGKGGWMMSDINNKFTFEHKKGVLGENKLKKMYGDNVPRNEFNKNWGPPSSDVVHDAALSGYPIESHGSLKRIDGSKTIQGEFEIPARTNGSLKGGGLSIASGLFSTINAAQYDDKTMQVATVIAGITEATAGSIYISAQIMGLTELAKVGTRLGLGAGGFGLAIASAYQLPKNIREQDHVMTAANTIGTIGGILMIAACFSPIGWGAAGVMGLTLGAISLVGHIGRMTSIW